MGRYTVSPNEGFEPNSNNEALKNYLNIKSRKIIEEIEEQELKRTELELLKIFDKDHRFTAKDICNIHELWLGDIYPFAGYYRTVTMSKAGFPFASPQQIESCMRKFELEYLSKYTPCHYPKLDDLSSAIGIVHVELILIHPFREGNGRTARLISDLMAGQAGKPSLNYAYIDQTKNKTGFEQYISAIQAGVPGNYEPIKKIFKKLIEASIT